MPKTSENRESARESDNRKSGESQGGELTGYHGSHGVRFPVHNHPDKSEVRGKLKQ